MSWYKKPTEVEELATLLYTLCENRAMSAREISTEVIGHVGVIPVSTEPVYELVKRYRNTRAGLEDTAKAILKELAIPDSGNTSWG